jgi:hypothetical protein
LAPSTFSVETGRREAPSAGRRLQQGRRNAAEYTQVEIHRGPFLGVFADLIDLEEFSGKKPLWYQKPSVLCNRKRSCSVFSSAKKEDKCFFMLKTLTHITCIIVAFDCIGFQENRQVMWGSATPCAIPHQPSIFSNVSFLVLQPVSLDERHLLAGATASDFSVSW